VPGSRLACAVRRRWPARAAEKGAGGVPRRSFCFSTRDAERARADNEAKRNYPTAARRNIGSSKAPSAVPVERGAS
jgi:hypothetical protein